MSLKYEPASETLHISVQKLFSIREHRTPCLLTRNLIGIPQAPPLAIISIGKLEGLRSSVGIISIGKLEGLRSRVWASSRSESWRGCARSSVGTRSRGVRCQANSAHIDDQGQILALAFRLNFFYLLKVFPLRSEAA